MYVLTARQCPQCVLRFGSSSELDQHLRLDHPPAPQPEALPAVAEPPTEHEHRAAAEPAPDARRFVDTAIVVGALIAFVAVISWHVAGILSFALGAAALLRAAVTTKDTPEVTK